MLQDITTRFAHIANNKLYYMATLLDPRFKDRFLDKAVVTLAVDHMEEVTATVREEPDGEPVHHLTSDEDDDLGRGAEGESSPKRMKFNIWEKVKIYVSLTLRR